MAPTHQAAATATERAWQITGWTVTTAVEQTIDSAKSTATAQAWTPTPNFTATVGAAQVAAQATALHAEAVNAELAIERGQMTNLLQAVLPWILLVVLLPFLLIFAWNWSKTRLVQRDLRGDAPLIITNGKVYDADRNPYPLVDLSGPKPQIPALTPQELQSVTTARPDDRPGHARRTGTGQPTTQNTCPKDGRAEHPASARAGADTPTRTSQTAVC